jgi:hypothetical protein
MADELLRWLISFPYATGAKRSRRMPKRGCCRPANRQSDLLQPSIEVTIKPTKMIKGHAGAWRCVEMASGRNYLQLDLVTLLMA